MFVLAHPPRLFEECRVRTSEVDVTRHACAGTAGMPYGCKFVDFRSLSGEPLSDYGNASRKKLITATSAGVKRRAPLGKSLVAEQVLVHDSVETTMVTTGTVLPRCGS